MPPWMLDAGCREPEGCSAEQEAWGSCLFCRWIRCYQPLRGITALSESPRAAMFPSCYSKTDGSSSSKGSSLAKLLLGVFVVYMLHTAWLLYGFLNTKSCEGDRGEHCITSYLAARPTLQLSVFTCLIPDNSQLSLAVKIDPFDPYAPCERQVNVSLPEETRANGTLYAVVYVHRAGVSPLEDNRGVHHAAPLTTHIPPLHTRALKRPARPVAHWRPRLSVSVMSEDFPFTKAALPSDVRRYMRVSQDGRQMVYLPLLLVNELSFRVKDLMEIGAGTDRLPLTLSYEGISLRRFRFWVHLQDVVYSLRQFGFTEEHVDEIKETLMGSDLYLLVLTAVVTAFQFLEEEEEHGGDVQEVSPVAESRHLADLPPPAGGHQSAGAASRGPGSMCGGLEGVQSVQDPDAAERFPAPCEQAGRGRAQGGGVRRAGLQMPVLLDLPPVHQRRRVLAGLLTPEELLFLVDQHPGLWSLCVWLPVHGAAALHQP
ncbi:lipid scramblase CLPTM1L-like isoform X2 [Betta splendens]|uniref:Lipid scramblase CLPTM1L n=1 Tax=Betta splendens TaxID=158456 RepID=A0A6P7KMX1_BETSP|nr:lipid scramblase CLPTM1L-like isoform X2 [Betta splendens]